MRIYGRAARRWRAGDKRAVFEGVPTRRAHSQAGATLVEALVAIAILTILLLGVMAGMVTALTTSRSNHGVAETRTAFAVVSDRVSTMAYPGCADPTALTASLNSPAPLAPSGYSAEIVAVDNLLPASPNCVTATSVRKLTVKVTRNDNTASLTGEVVVRNQQARP